MNKYKDSVQLNGEALGAKRHYIYMVSIHKHQKKDFVTKAELDTVLQDLIVKLAYTTCGVINTVYESTHRYNQLHLHTLLICLRDFRYFKYTKSHGFMIHFRKVYNLSGIQHYLSKQVMCHPSQDQVLDENWYLNNYGFI